MACKDDSPCEPCKCPTLSYGNLPSDMYLAAKNGDLKKVRQFLENGNDINAADGDGYTLLASACVGGQVAIVRFLQQQLYLHRNTRDWAGDTPLMHATMMGHIDVVKELISRPHMCYLDVNALNKYEETALNIAISGGHGELEEMLKKIQLPKLPAPGDLTIITPVKTKCQLVMRLECEVCLEEYNTNERRARTLSCGHSLCTSCVAGILSIGNLCCPLCRQKHINHAVKAEDVPVNFAVDGVIRQMELQ